MKKIDAVIRPHKLDAVREALQEAGFRGLTVIEAKGYGIYSGQTERYRGSENAVRFALKLKIEIVCIDERTDKAVEIIIKNSRTDEEGDGKIFVSKIDDVIRVRTEESGEMAL